MQKAEEKLRSGLRTAQRIVIKIGTNTISTAQNSSGGVDGVDLDYLATVARQVSDLLRAGTQVMLVSSGAIGMGAQRLGLRERSSDIAVQQACASIGQPRLMQAYQHAFDAHGVLCAQILLTRSLFYVPQSFQNLKNTLEKLLALDIVPIINENDSVSTEEIRENFGDNDKLSAYIASKIAADLLIILSDVDGLYDSNPKHNAQAKKISYVEELRESHWAAAAAGRGSSFSRGGMQSKLEAVRMVTQAGCPVVLAHGRGGTGTAGKAGTNEAGVISAIVRGEAVGSIFMPSVGV